MEIQIMSTLAMIYSQLTAKSGVKLKAEVDKRGNEIALPDPQTDPIQYLEEVISQWSAGCSHLSPTWRHLLKVVRDIGLIELSQQIETYMKGMN